MDFLRLAVRGSDRKDYPAGEDNPIPVVLVDQNVGPLNTAVEEIRASLAGLKAEVDELVAASTPLSAVTNGDKPVLDTAAEGGNETPETKPPIAAPAPRRGRPKKSA